MKTKMCLIYSTFEDEREAKHVGRLLVEKKLVACVNVVPRVHSIYRWKNNVEEAEEAVLIAKTTNEGAERVVVEIKSLHSYELPAVLVVPVVDGLEDFISYVRDEVI